MPRPYPSLKNDEQQNITTEFPPLSRAILPAARIAAVMTPSFLMIRECRMERIFDITTWEALDAAVAALRQCADKKVYYLEGTLGAGKTTFVQHWLRQAGYSGVVQSPTYALMNEYYIGQQTVIHADLYRLAAPDELLYLDVRDWSERATHIFIEWAQNGGDYLPAADVFCQFVLHDGRRYLSVAAA